MSPPRLHAQPRLARRLGRRISAEVVRQARHGQGAGYPRPVAFRRGQDLLDLVGVLAHEPAQARVVAGLVLDLRAQFADELVHGGPPGQIFIARSERSAAGPPWIARIGAPARGR